jgi:hypothetical protein
MLHPNGAHLFIGRKLAALSLRVSFVKRSLFLSSQWNHRFIDPPTAVDPGPSPERLLRSCGDHRLNGYVGRRTANSN